MRKTWEKSYPYVISIVPLVLLGLFGERYIEDKNLNDVLNALLTVASLIIGFIAAILPIVLSVKNDSRVIRYVFLLDKEKLFLKYIKQTILMGVFLIMIVVSLYFREQYIGSFYYRYGFAFLCYVLIAFLLCTYRALKNILELLFIQDKKKYENDKFNYQSPEEIEFENSLKKSDNNTK